MEKKQTLWVISELFPPEETSTSYIMGTLANAFVRKYNVRVICGPDVYDEKKSLNGRGVKIDKSIKVFRLPRVPENKHSKLSRIKKFLLMSWRIYKKAKKVIKEGDKVLMVSNPFPLVILMGHLRQHRNFELSMLVHDIFPEGLYTEMSLPSFAYKLLEKVFNKAYASTDKLISLGRDMNEILAKKVTKYKKRPEIVMVENWGDVENIKPEERRNIRCLRIQYAGNIGRAQGVGDLVELLHEADNKDIVFNIWGTGSTEEEIKYKVAELKMDKQVKFNGPYSRSQQQFVLNDSDLSIVTLVKGMYGLGVPSKTYNILAAGKPILYIGEKGTEIWRTVEENQIGYCFEPDDRIGIVDLLNTLSCEKLHLLKEMGARARKVVERKYSRSVILDKFLEVV